MSKPASFKVDIIPFPELQVCVRCSEEYSRGTRDIIDMKIWHDNGHVWPGFAGEPDGGNYGGSDF